MGGWVAPRRSADEVEVRRKVPTKPNRARLSPLKRAAQKLLADDAPDRQPVRPPASR
jgi:hypothetical protein